MKLYRIRSTDIETLGQFVDTQNRVICKTLEKPWKDNARSVSCIPIGRYLCNKITTPKHGVCFEVTNVPNRANILIHWGNFVTDSEGCIIVGDSFADLNKDGAIDVTKSRETFHAFMDALEDVQSFWLSVLNS